jgi:hypothetical protein
MDINEQLQPIVATLLEGLKGSLEQELRDQINTQIIEKIANTEIDTVVERLIEQRLTDRIAEYDFAGKSKTKLDQAVTELSTHFSKSLSKAANEKIVSEVNILVGQMDITSVINTVVESKLSNLVNTGCFPPNSIPHTSVNIKGLKLSGDQIEGGIIDRFGSTGIEDRATHVQMTLMDHATAFEGPIWAPSAAIKGTLTVDGDLIINGNIPTDTPVFTKLIEETSASVRVNLNDEFFSGFSNTVFDRIKLSGLDLDRITQGNKEVISGNKLGYHITDSNLQRVGVLKDLQTQGENLLCNTLYVTDSGRVGINTMDPSAVFSLWDEEVEINISKRSGETGHISTPRNQRLILGANNKENIILETDGGVSVTKLSIGDIPMTSANYVPNYNGTLGQIVWNSAPSHSSPIGWVCLGATRWASFGTVE